MLCGSGHRGGSNHARLGIVQYPNTKYSSLYLSCALVPIWRGFATISPPSRVAWLISVLEAAYGRVRSAGIKAKAHALDLCYRF